MICTTQQAAISKRLHHTCVVFYWFMVCLFVCLVFFILGVLLYLFIYLLVIVFLIIIFSFWPLFCCNKWMSLFWKILSSTWKRPWLLCISCQSNRWWFKFNDIEMLVIQTAIKTHIHIFLFACLSYKAVNMMYDAVKFGILTLWVN